ncbi:hypothetical protein Q4S57_11770 [Priestia megaterium]|uniref:hypothetical protein n=1 Tax=Priestia megaterium TaxID=1404 RepID=UPI0026E238EF|nr:hypothetical protein [Priestia megaterium]MDO6848629.1 hypothetical protein [Priestia megaterium]
MMFALIVVVGIVALGVASFYVIKRPQGAVDPEDRKPLVSVNGHVKFAEGINQISISKIDMYDQRLVINQVAIIPFNRIQRAEFSKVVKNEKGLHGAPVQRYFGELTIHFIDKNGQETYIRCETPKKNQFHLIYQYDLMKRQLNKRLGLEDQQPYLTLQEPYEL